MRGPQFQTKILTQLTYQNLHFQLQCIFPEKKWVGRANNLQTEQMTQATADGQMTPGTWMVVVETEHRSQKHTAKVTQVTEDMGFVINRNKPSLVPLQHIWPGNHEKASDELVQRQCTKESLQSTTLPEHHKRRLGQSGGFHQLRHRHLASGKNETEG